MVYFFLSGMIGTASIGPDLIGVVPASISKSPASVGVEG
jgi:hypothetical protein